MAQSSLFCLGIPIRIVPSSFSVAQRSLAQDYNLIKIFDSEYKPSSNQIIARLDSYEQINDIAPYKKQPG